MAVGEDDEGAGELDVEVGADGAFVDEGALVSVVLDGDGEAVGAWVGAVAVELVGDVVAEGEEAFVGAGVDVLVGTEPELPRTYGEVEEPDVGRGRRGRRRRGGGRCRRSL